MTQKKIIETFAKLDFGLVLFFLYALLSIFYYQERTLFLDNPFQIFHMIVEDKIEIMAGRWPASIVRYLPFLGIKAGLPLSTILFLFSLSYVIFHFLVFAILKWGMQEKQMANFYALWLLLISGHAFFWNNSELIQASSVLFIFMALVKKEDSGLIRRFLILAVLILLLFYHPLVIIPIGAILFFWMLQNPKRAKEYLIYLFSGIILYGVKSKYFTNWYDTGKQGAFGSNLKEIGFDIFKSDGFINNIQSFFLGWNCIITLACLAAMFIFFQERKWMCLISLPLAILAYIILISFADPNQVYAFYNEVNFIPLLCIVLLGCMQLSHKLVSNKIMVLVLLLFFVFRISFEGRFYTERIQYWESEISSAKEKQIKSESEMDMSKLVMSWASPYESLIISKLQELPEARTILVHPDPKKFDGKMNASDFLTHFKHYTIREVNGKYFNLSELSGY